MLVGGLLDVLVIPSVPGIVGPGLHGGQHVLRVGHTVQHAVDHGHDVRAADGLVGAELIAVADDPAGLNGLADIFGGPVTCGVAEIAHGFAGVLITDEAGGDGGELRAGNVLVGQEAAVLGKVAQRTGLQAGGNGVVVPVARIHVGKGVGVGPIGAAEFIRHQTEEDSDCLGAGDVGQGTHSTVLVADDIREMVVGVQADGAAQRRLLIVDRGAGVSGSCRRGSGSGREHGRGIGSRGRRGSRSRIGCLLILKLSPRCGNGDVAISIFYRFTPAGELIALAGGIVRIQSLVTVALIEGFGLDGCIIVSVFPSHSEGIRLCPPRCGNGDVAISIFHRFTPAGELIALAGGIVRIQSLVTVALIESFSLDRCIIVSVFPSHGESIRLRSLVDYINRHVLQLGRSFHKQFIGSVVIDYRRFLSLQGLDIVHSEGLGELSGNAVTVLINIVDGPGVHNGRILNSDNLISGRHCALYDIHFRAIAVKFRRRYIVFLSSLALLVN